MPQLSLTPPASSPAANPPRTKAWASHLAASDGTGSRPSVERLGRRRGAVRRVPKAESGRVLQRRVMYKPRRNTPAFLECRGVSAPLRPPSLSPGVARQQGGRCRAEGCTSAGRAIDNLPKRGPSRCRSGGARSQSLPSRPLVPRPAVPPTAGRRKHQTRYLRLCTAIRLSCNGVEIGLWEPLGSSNKQPKQLWRPLVLNVNSVPPHLAVPWAHRRLPVRPEKK